MFPVKLVPTHISQFLLFSCTVSLSHIQGVCQKLKGVIPISEVNRRILTKLGEIIWTITGIILYICPVIENLKKSMLFG